MTTKTRNISRLIVFLLLALWLMPMDGGGFVDDRRELGHGSSFLYSTPGCAGAEAGLVETPQRTRVSVLEQKHVAALSPGKFSVEFVRAAAFLSKEPAKGSIPHCARRSIPTRAPPFAMIEL